MPGDILATVLAILWALAAASVALIAVGGAG
jgi:hypothetical protein